MWQVSMAVCCILCFGGFGLAIKLMMTKESKKKA